MKWLEHAFATDPTGPAIPNEEQRLIVDRLAREVVRRRLTSPALLTLELARPLNYMSAQVLHFFQPFLSVIGDAAAYEEFASFLEQRGSIEYISGRVEAIDAEHAATGETRQRRDDR